MTTTIMVAVDGSPEAEDALAQAIDLTNKLTGKIHLDLIHVTEIQQSSWLDPFHDRIELITNFEARHETDQLTKVWLGQVKEWVSKDKSNRSGEVMCFEGDPRYVLCEKASKNVDFVVIGTRGLGPIKSAIMGSIAKYLVSHAPCPVIVTKKKE